MRYHAVVLSLAVAVGAALPSAFVAGVPSASAQAAPSPTPARDWALPAGHYYTEAGAGAGGYAIADEGGMAFWSAYQHLGGAATLGFPSSRPYSQGGFVYQATQAAVLQWRPETGAVVLGNTFEMLHDAGQDDWLASSKGVPRPIASDGATSYADAVQVRLGWLTESAIRDHFLANPNPTAVRSWSQSDAIQLYGLPMSKPERVGPFIAQRFQRIAFQIWVDAVPGMPAPGTVTAVLGGDLLKEAGLIAGLAAAPHKASDVVGRPVPLGSGLPVAGPPQVALPTATPRPVATAPSRSTPPAGATLRPRPDLVLDGTLSEYAISLPQIGASTGTIRFTLTNVGTLRHDLHVIGNGVDEKSPELAARRSGAVDVTFTEPGAYTVYCDLGDHADRGMSLTFTIEG
jgi:hypothetical protein